MTKYTLSVGSPTSIVASSSQAWSATLGLPPYSATVFVISGTMAQAPSVECDLNPNTIMVSARGSVTLQPKLIAGTGTVTPASRQSDSGITAAATQPHLTATQNGTVTVTAGSAPDSYHYTVPGADNAGVTENQS